MIKNKIKLLVLFVFAFNLANAQCVPDVYPIVTSSDTSICEGESAHLWAYIHPDYPLGGTPTSITLSDDQYSGLIPIGFTFNFYGVDYTSCVISSNNYLTFNGGSAGGYSGYSITDPAPSTNTPPNSIMCPWQDINPGAGGVVRYQTIGVAPNRVFVVEYCNIPMYSCTGMLFTDQIKLFEGCNEIETHIMSKPLCTAWNSGRAIHGLSKNSTLAHIVPGRNSPTHWTVTNDGYRFIPDPADVNNYTMNPIAFNPFLMNTTEANIVWYEEGSTIPLGTGPAITVTPSVSPTNYVATITSGGDCIGVQVSSVITVDFDSEYFDTVSAEICAGSLYEHHGDILYSSGTYTKQISREYGCDTFYTVHLSINPLPNVEVTANNQFICQGENAALTNLYPNSTTTYQWLRNNIVIPGATQSSYAAAVEGEYRLTAISDKGCVDTSRRITIVVNPAATVNLNSLEVNIDNICIGDTVLVSVNGQANYEYRWFPQKFFIYSSNRGFPEANAILFEPSYITVVAFNEFGCMATDSMWVNPVPCCDVYLPSAFSPNGDGLNDYFSMLVREGQQIVSFQVFDRLGRLVYDNFSKLGWDGRDLNGNEVAQAVYFYRIIYSCSDKKNYEAKGDITLIR